MIVGIDFSLTGTGVCAITDGEPECITEKSGPGSEWWMHPLRVQRLADNVAEWATEKSTVPAWVIESPSYGSRGRGHDMVLSGWWLFIDHLMQLGWEPPLRATPSQVKKFATANGNAKKHEVMLAVERQYPDARIKNDNEADAVILAAIGAAAYGEPFNGTLRKHQQEVVAAVAAGK